MDYTAGDSVLAARVEDGIPVIDVVAFGKSVGFSAAELANLIRIPARTYARRVASKARLRLDEGERAVRVMRLYGRAKRVFGSDEKTRLWLSRQLAVLGGRTPLDFARTEPGAREVEAVLDRLEEGVFS